MLKCYSTVKYYYIPRNNILSNSNSPNVTNIGERKHRQLLGSNNTYIGVWPQAQYLNDYYNELTSFRLLYKPTIHYLQVNLSENYGRRAAINKLGRENRRGLSGIKRLASILLSLTSHKMVARAYRLVTVASLMFLSLCL